VIRPRFGIGKLPQPTGAWYRDAHDVYMPSLALARWLATPLVGAAEANSGSALSSCDPIHGDQSPCQLHIRRPDGRLPPVAP
jgi:hypothetical protein